MRWTVLTVLFLQQPGKMKSDSHPVLAIFHLFGTWSRICIFYLVQLTCTAAIRSGLHRPQQGFHAHTYVGKKLHAVFLGMPIREYVSAIAAELVTQFITTDARPV